MCSLGQHYMWVSCLSTSCLAASQCGYVYPSAIYTSCPLKLVAPTSWSAFASPLSPGGWRSMLWGSGAGLTIGVIDDWIGWDGGDCDLAGGVDQISHGVCLREGDLLDDGGLGESRACGWSTCVLHKKDLVGWLIPSNWTPFSGCATQGGRGREGQACSRTHQTTASWKIGSVSTWAMRVNVGLSPRME